MDYYTSLPTEAVSKTNFWSHDLHTDEWNKDRLGMLRIVLFQRISKNLHVIKDHDSRLVLLLLLLSLYYPLGCANASSVGGLRF